MGKFEDRLNVLKEEAIAFIKQRVQDEPEGRYVLDNRLLVTVDVEFADFEGWEQLAIYELSWSDEINDVMIHVAGSDGCENEPDPLGFHELDAGDIIALADMLDTPGAKKCKSAQSTGKP
jgi:hypothetical protein